MRRYLLPIVTIIPLLAACSNPSIKALPPPPSTVAPIQAADLQDYSGKSWVLVAGKVTSTTQKRNGSSTLNGTVSSGGAAVSGAIVVIEYFFDDSGKPATIRSVTDSSGTYRVEKLLGGRYRVRAFRAPDLGMETGQTMFLKDGDAKTLNLSLTAYSGVTLSWAMAPNPPILSQPANVAIQLTQKGVSSDGLISSLAMSGVSVTLANATGISLQSSAVQVTTSSGLAQWTLTCTILAVPSVTFVVSGSSPQIVQLPSCSPVPSTTTTSAAPTTTTT